MSPRPPQKGLTMYLVMYKSDYNAIEGLKDITNMNSVYVVMFSDSKKARAYCREIIADELAHDEQPSTFVILDVNEYKSNIVTGKLGVIISSRDLK